MNYSALEWWFSTAQPPKLEKILDCVASDMISEILEDAYDPEEASINEFYAEIDNQEQDIIEAQLEDISNHGENEADVDYDDHELDAINEIDEYQNDHSFSP